MSKNRKLHMYNKRFISPVSSIGLITHTTEPCPREILLQDALI